MKNQIKTNQNPDSIETDILTFIKTNNLVDLLNYLKQLPIGAQADIKPMFITFTIYKKDISSFEINTTANGWLTTTMDSKLLSLFFFGKIDSSFFEWT